MRVLTDSVSETSSDQVFRSVDGAGLIEPSETFESSPAPANAANGTGEAEKGIASAAAPTASTPAAGQTANVGYYDITSGGPGSARYADPILAMGFTATPLETLTPADLSGLDILFLLNPNNVGYGTEFLAALANVQAFASAGGIVIIHDRYVDNAESILPGLSGVTIVRSLGASIDIEDDDGVVAIGPGGTLTDNSLDGGNSSAHGYALRSSLPPNATVILTTDNPDHVVTFSYPYGAGTIIYSSIPLDYYLQGSGSASLWQAFQDYTENLLTSVYDLPPGLIAGVLFNDRDGDGTREAGEEVLAGRTVILDDNGNGLVDAGETTAVTDGLGLFSFETRAGRHSLTQVLPEGWRQTGGPGPVVVTVPTGGTADAVLSSVEIATVTGGLAGVLFHDENRDAVRDAGEPDLAGWTVYLDANNNGQLDAGETATLTDNQGAYQFLQLDPGDYVIRAELPLGWEAWQSQPGSATVTVGAILTGQDIAVTGGTTPFDDIADGTRYDDVIDGRAGNDFLSGHGGNDQISGGTGLDRLRGGSGDDVLTGGRGDDRLGGGLGADDFVFAGLTGQDRIKDFSVAEGDLIWIDTASVLDFSDLTLTQDGLNTLVAWAEGSVLLRGVAPGDLTDGSFRFAPFPDVQPAGAASFYALEAASAARWSGGFDLLL